MAYAATTSVSVEKTQGEIQALLRRFGADDIAMRENSREMFGQVAFRCKDRLIRFALPLPDPKERRFQRNGRGGLRTPLQLQEAWMQECKSRWRGLLLCIRAKIESVESRIEAFDEAFLAQTVDPATGHTVSETIIPALEMNYKTGGGNAIALLPFKGPES